MISILNYLIPYIGIAMCIIVLLTRRVNTSCSVRAAKLCFWAVIWVLLMWADWEKSFVPVASITLARSIAFTINLLDIKDAMNNKVRKQY